ncbi:MAG: PilN domain-containing protein [Candidatus Kryptoniota bacterium]
MNLSINKINFLWLSGIRNILGIDFAADAAGGGENYLRVAELRSYGGILNKFRSRYKVANKFTVEFENGQSAEEKGQRLTKELKERGIKTRFCVSSISSTTARTVTAEIPSDVGDVGTWIRENYEKFIRVPVPLRELAFAYEMLPSVDDSRRCEISFVRETERQECISLFSAAGLHLLNLGLCNDIPSDDPVITALCPAGYSGNLAVGLALKGFLPEISSMDFRAEAEKKKTGEEKEKTLFNRTALVLGAVLFLLLAAQFGLNSYLQSASDKIDERLMEVGPVYSEVSALQRQVSALRSELNGDGGTSRRSNVSKVLHDIAKATPEGIWLYKLDIARGNSGGEVIDLFGYARSNQDAASYLGALQEDKRFSNVQVIRVGAPTQSEAVSFDNTGIKSVTTFELKMGEK